MIHENRAVVTFPFLDLDVLILGSHQLYERPDLPNNMDLGDIHTIIGGGYLHQEHRTIFDEQQSN